MDSESSFGQTEHARNTHDLFSRYFEYTRDTEPPIIYHRWTYINLLGASIGRKAFLRHGHFRVFPNLYTMLIGEPAARKSTSIKMGKKLFAAAGFSKFAADKTSKEKFLLDLEGLEVDDSQQFDSRGKSKAKYDAITAENLWGRPEEDRTIREVFIVADEFNEFAGAGNLEFYTTLGNFWDFDSPDQSFTQRLKNSRSVSIYQPTISILAGNTPDLFARAFPPEAIGSGFLSRLLLIHGEKSGRKITFPRVPSQELAASIISYFQTLLLHEFDEVTLSSAARAFLHEIYQNEEPLSDTRFKGYNGRRFTQLLKLCIIISCAQFQTEITENDVLYANTILTHAELLMPKALGEFGKSKNSDVVNKIVNIIEASIRPVTMVEIHRQTHRDISQRELQEQLQSLLAANKLQLVSGKRLNGFLPKKEPRSEKRYVDMSLLTQEERDMI